MVCSCVAGTQVITSTTINFEMVTDLGQGGGLVLTQYSPGSLAAYPISTYLLLLFQVFLSAISGVYNQVLLENVESSLHALNMTLYAAGAVFNLVAYFLVKTLKVDEPGLFVGYDSFSAIMVIISNVFVGLATTAVYKCKFYSFLAIVISWLTPNDFAM